MISPHKIRSAGIQLHPVLLYLILVENGSQIRLGDSDIDTVRSLVWQVVGTSEQDSKFLP